MPTQKAKNKSQITIDWRKLIKINNQGQLTLSEGLNLAILSLNIFVIVKLGNNRIMHSYKLTNLSFTMADDNTNL